MVSRRSVWPLAPLCAVLLTACSGSFDLPFGSVVEGLPIYGAAKPTLPDSSPERLDIKGRRLDLGTALAMVNAYRRENGVGPLALDPGLTPLAQAQADLMKRHDSLQAAMSEHHGLRARLVAVGYQSRTAGENIAVGQLTFRDVLTAWQNSRGHNRNLLDADFTHVAIVAAQDPSARFKVYWAMVFSKPR